MNTENNKPETQAAPAAETAPAPAPIAAAVPKPTPAPAPQGMAPQTKGNVTGGWNRFAGYKPGQAKDKQKDRRDDRRGRR